jgi:hypothetical protein
VWPSIAAACPKPPEKGKKTAKAKESDEKIDLIVSINYPLAGLGGCGTVYVELVARARQREYSIS